MIRSAAPADVPGLCLLIRAFAEFGGVSEELVLEERRLHEDLFGPRPSASALVASDSDPGGSLVGFAIFCDKYSTLLGHPVLHVEDLFVLEEHRGRGLGTGLLAEVARAARDGGYSRIEWTVGDSNQPAITFYRSIGATAMDDRTTYRLTGEALSDLAKRSTPNEGPVSPGTQPSS